MNLDKLWSRRGSWRCSWNQKIFLFSFNGGIVGVGVFVNEGVLGTVVGEMVSVIVGDVDGVDVSVGLVATVGVGVDVLIALFVFDNIDPTTNAIQNAINKPTIMSTHLLIFIISYIFNESILIIILSVNRFSMLSNNLFKILYTSYMKRNIICGIIACLFLATHVFAGNPPDQGKSTINGTMVPADGLTSSTVTISIKDATGNTVSGNDSIVITSTNSSTSFNPSSVTLDGSGIFYTQMKSTFVGSVPVTVTDSSVNTQITGYVYFYQPGTAAPPPGACLDPAPGSTAKLISAVSSDAHAITLTWTDADNPVTYYLLSYGLSSGNYIYGVPNIGGQGATSFTVGGLSTGKKYYFVIRAGNGCTPGAFSNELSAIPGTVATATPVPTQTPQQTVDSNNAISIDTPVPAISVDTPTPTPAGLRVLDTGVPATPNASNSFVNQLMIGATAFGVVCAGVGLVFFLRMKKNE